MPRKPRRAGFKGTPSWMCPKRSTPHSSGAEAPALVLPPADDALVERPEPIETASSKKWQSLYHVHQPVIP